MALFVAQSRLNCVVMFCFVQIFSVLQLPTAPIIHSAYIFNLAVYKYYTYSIFQIKFKVNSER